MSDTLARGRRSSLRSLVFSKFTTSDWNKLSASVWQAGMGHRSFSIHDRVPAYPITRNARNDGSSFAAQIRDTEGDDQRS
jgi:hypothetical protein